MRGKLKCWWPVNGAGFIVRPGEKDIFAHANNFFPPLNDVAPTVGAEFEYEIGSFNGRECAKQIKPVDE
jgi:cold shock CspA family protein